MVSLTVLGGYDMGPKARIETPSFWPQEKEPLKACVCTRELWKGVP